MKYFVLVLMIVAANAVNAQTDIHSVDFKNFTYLADCAGEKPEKITVKDGEFAKETKTGDYTEHMSFDIMSVAYGDLNGDKQDEAVILSVCNTGGTGQFTEGFVYTMKAGKPVLLITIPGGDRAEGGLVSGTVENGLLVIKANDADQNSGACCPEYTLTTKYRVVGNKLVATGKGVRAEIYPRERLTFDKGTSGKTFKVKIDSNDRKRYTVGAGAGQTLTVSTDSDGVDPGLLGDTEATQGKNSFTVKLPKKGDYTFEIANNTENPKVVTVTVTIK